MKVEVTGDMRAFVRRFGRAGAVATAAGVRAAAEGLKLDMRQVIARAGLGTRLGNAIGSRVYPSSGPSFSAAGIVYPRGPKAREILSGFSSAAPITARDGKGWLAIPVRTNTPYLGRTVKLTPAAVEARLGKPLRWVKPQGKRFALLVAEGVRVNTRGRVVASKPGRRTRRPVKDVVMFILVPQVLLGKRLDFRQLARTWAGRAPGLIRRALGA